MIGALIDKILESPAVYTLYQYIVRRGAVIERTLMRELQRGPGVRILDLGCGSGLYSGLFDPVCYLGVDACLRYLRFARRDNGAHRFGVMNICDLALRAESMDQVFAVGVFHHLSDHDSARAVEEVRRVLKRGGRMVLVELIPPVSRYDLLGRILVAADRGHYVRTTEGYRNFFLSAFAIVQQYRIRTGPYDFCVFVMTPGAS